MLKPFPVVPTRRQFLVAAATIPWASELLAQSPTRIERVHEPENLESNFSRLNAFLTPTESFFVRNHFGIPQWDATTYRLQVEGAVRTPLSLTLAELKALAGTPITRPLTLECAGNGRVYLTPPVRGVAWQSGAVGTAEWTGCPLAKVLEKAGVESRAVEVVLEGADSGTVADPPSPGPIAFARSLPVEKALRPEVLLAWGMNGAPLAPRHGAPLRAVVGGWYGMASVKWLKRILVVTEPFQGFYQTLDYSYFRRVAGIPTLTPITTMQVKSQIARPAPHDVIPADRPYSIVGAAWAGEHDVVRVDVSVDGGHSWSPAELAPEKAPFCWRLWRFDWKSPRRGIHRLMARATDDRGNTQPMQRDPDRRTYMISHVVPVEVEVR